MLQAEKMASIGQLAAGVAHEINNPMGFIFSNFSTLEGYVQDLSVLIATYDVLEEYIKKGDAPNIREVRKTIRIQKEELDLDFLLADIDELIQESRQGVERVRQIVENLKDFAQVDHEGKKHTDLNSGIENTLSMVGSEILNKATVTKEYGDLPEVMCYPRELNQALVNVLVNAAQAVEGEGNIIIHTFQENGYACIAVTDDGKGMPPEVKQRIFDPFYTTRDVGEGTGMGLSMTYNIVVDKHGGEIQVDSEEGTGTTFTIKIPA
jgi:signal transduction histidine kinase